MSKTFSLKDKLIVIALSVVILASTATTAFVGIKLFKNDTPPVEESTQKDGKITLADIKKPETDYENKDFSDKIKDGVLKVADCGAEADALYDWGPLLRSVFKTAAENSGTVVELDKGVYYVAPLEPTDTYVFDLGEYGAEGLTIRGNGATFMLMDNYLGCFSFRNSNNVTVENMIFDCLEDPFIQATVTEFDTSKQVLTIETDEVYTVFDDARMQDRFQTAYGMVRNASNPYLMKNNCNNFFFFTTYEKLEDKKFSVSLSSQTADFTNKYIEVGDKITLNNRKGETTFIFDICEAGNFTVKDITILNSPGGGIVGRQNYGEIKISGLIMMIDPKGNNWLCGNADGVHIQGCRGNVIIEDSLFSNLSDDAVNLYQWASDVKKVVSPTVIEVHTNVSPIKVGDVIEFCDQQTGQIFGSSKVKAIEQIAGQRIDRQARLILETEVRGMTAGKEKQYVYFSREKDFSNTVIRNTTFMNIRGRGLVLCSADTLVENCTFENISNHALNGWFVGEEGYEITNLDFKNNKIKNCHYLIPEVDKGKSGAIDITISNAAYIQSEYKAHNNINIVGNTITDYHGCAVRIGNSSNVNIKENFFDLKDVGANYSVNNVLYLNRSENITISDNVFNDNSAKLSAVVRYDEKSVKNINIDNNTFAADTAKQVVKD